MPMLEVKNRDYQARIETAIINALMESTLDPETRTATLLSGEIVQACLNVIAMMAGTSEVSASPTRLRQFGDECAKSIRARTAEVRRQHQSGNTPFHTVVHAGDRH
jgi:hypothetical protein